MVILTGLGHYLPRLAGVGAATLLAAEGLARVGAPVAGFLGARPAGALDRVGLGVLAGLPLVGFAYLGLALASLFHPLLLAAAPLALLAAARPWRAPRPMLLDAARDARGFGWPALACGAAGLLSLTPRMLVPEAEDDCRVYHLGVPWQYLQAGKALLEHVQFNYHVPLTFEMTFALPVALGDDRLAKGLVGLGFAAGCAVWAGRRRGGAGAWLGPLVALSTPLILWYATVAKNDVLAGALFVAGALLWSEGRRTAGAAFLGLCVGSKFTYLPLAVAWAAWFWPWRRPRWRWVWWGALLAAPSVPWMIKSWLATRNPLFQFASSVIPTLNYGAENRALFDRMIRSGQPFELPGWTDLPAHWAWYLRTRHLPLLAGLPGLFLTGGWWRALALETMAAQMLQLKVAAMERYLLPSVWLASLGMGEALARAGRGRLTPWLTYGTAVLALARIAAAPETTRAGWEGGFQPWDRVVREKFTTFHDFHRIVAPDGLKAASWAPRAPRPPRVLDVGFWHTYQIPGRVLFNGMVCETPVIQRLARTSRDAPEFAKRFRQLGATRMVFNLVSADWYAATYGVFPWGERMLRLYVGWCRSHLTVLGRTDRVDYLNGAYVVYRVSAAPAARPADAVWFAPGTESAADTGMRLQQAGKTAEAVAEFTRLTAVMPEVGAIWNRLGHAYAVQGDSARAFTILKKFADLGMVDVMNLPELASTAVTLGHDRLAAELLDVAERNYRDQAGTVTMSRVILAARQALDAIGAKRLDEASRRLAEGDAALARSRPGAGSWNTASGMLLGVHGEFLLARGDRAGAAAFFRRSVETAPHLPMAPRWRSLGGAGGGAAGLFGGPR